MTYSSAAALILKSLASIPREAAPPVKASK
jgi:hypothetical protein